MKPGARITGAIEVLDEVLTRYSPVAMALTSWGKAHRFAGSGDRNAIGGLVYDALRRRASITWAMQSDSTRALALGAAGPALAMSVDEVVAACDGSQHAPAPLTDVERAGMTRALTDAPMNVQADVPEWLWPSFERVFGSRAIAEGQAMSQRAPADLRVNTLKATPEKVAKALASFGVVSGQYLPNALRVPPPKGPSRTPNLQAEAAFQAGWCEIQDEGSQIVAALAGAGPRLQVLDLCAGGGGKTLAFAAAMQNTGQLYAYDEDRMRLKPIFERVKRAGVRNVQILRAGDRDGLLAFGPRFDVVMVDAPCTGAGTWRRKPDAKWRLKPEALAGRIRDQQRVLTDAAALVKPGGRVIYVTCSILPEENGDQVQAFLAANPAFHIVPYADVWRANLPGEPPISADGGSDGLMLSPAQHGTDGFYVCVLERGKA